MTGGLIRTQQAEKIGMAAVMHGFFEAFLESFPRVGAAFCVNN